MQNENENLKLRLFNQTNDFNNQANDLKIKMALLEQEKNDLLEQNSNEMRILTVIIIIIHFLEQKIAKWLSVFWVDLWKDSNGIVNNSPVYLGPRSGQFRINSNNNVTYLTRHQKSNGSVLYDK